MADVDLDVHGVRYAQIHTDLKRDMKLQGLGFIALLDFTTVDTLRASLERVISDKTDREEKVETMCYYKKRRRGAVVIRTQRDVMMACCEYPLVTRTGKPAPDTYIRVGVGLRGVDGENMVTTLPLRTPRGSRPGPPGVGGRPPAVLGSLVRLNNNNGHALTKVMYRHIAPDHPETVAFITHDGEPPSKRMCLDNDTGWHLVASSASPPHTMEIKPLPGSSPDPDRGSPTPSLTIPDPPALPIQIKAEPLDMDEEDVALPYPGVVDGARRGIRSNSTGSTRRGQLRPGSRDEELGTAGSHDEQLGAASSHDEQLSTEEDEDDHLSGSRANSSSALVSEASSTHDQGLKLMWEQLKKMESRLTYMESSKTHAGSPPPPRLTPAPTSTPPQLTPAPTASRGDKSEGGLCPADLTGQMAALEQRLVAMEEERERRQREHPLAALEKRLAVMEKNISRTLSSVDKLSKSLTTINRKHVKTNGAVEVLCESVKTIRESQALGQSTLDSIKALLEKGIS